VSGFSRASGEQLDMTRTIPIRSFVVTGLLIAGSATGTQQGRAADPLPSGPLVFDSTTRGPRGNVIPGPKFRVVPLGGFVRPYALAFLPDGGMLVTERSGRLRIVRNGKLDPRPIAGIPEVLDHSLKGLNDIVLHPRFRENRTVYFTYYKPVAGSEENATATLARARFDGDHTLSDVRDIFSTDTVVNGASASRVVFGRDGKIYMAIGIPIPRSGNATVGDYRVATVTDAQDPNSHYGKVLRLNDDGSAPSDNPFSGRAGHKPEVYALGIRNAMGLYVHPDTGELWETENGLQGGDEINIIKAGRNYGWPVISYGRAYTGELTGGTGPVSDQPYASGMETPWLFWSPSIAPAGIAFYMGNRFPEWKGNIFVGALVGTQLQRIVLNPTNELPTRRQPMLTELKQRIREVREGPDGLLYLLTDEEAGALLRLEPLDDGQ
jgi:glucose/arabinose dehydrogenase